MRVMGSVMCVIRVGVIIIFNFVVRNMFRDLVMVVVYFKYGFILLDIFVGMCYVLINSDYYWYL